MATHSFIAALVVGIFAVLAPTEARADDALVAVRLRSPVPASLEARALDDPQQWDTLVREGETVKLSPGTELRVRLDDGTKLSVPRVPTQTEGVDVDVVLPSSGTRGTKHVLRSVGLGLGAVGGGVAVAGLAGWFVVRLGSVFGKIGQNACDFDYATPQQKTECEQSRARTTRQESSEEGGWLTAAAVGGLVAVGGLTVVLASSAIETRPTVRVRTTRDGLTARMGLGSSPRRKCTLHLSSPRVHSRTKSESFSFTRRRSVSSNAPEEREANEAIRRRRDAAR